MSFLDDIDSGESEAYRNSIATSRRELLAGCVMDDGVIDVVRISEKHPHFKEVAAAGAQFGQEVGTLLGVLLAGLTEVCGQLGEGASPLSDLLVETRRLVEVFRASPAPHAGTDVDDSRAALRRHCGEVLRCARREGVKTFRGIQLVQDFARQPAGVDW